MQRVFRFFVILSACNVNDRHTLVKGAIGDFPEEEYAYWLVNKISWILPLIIVLGAMVDILLVYIYMRFAHPWKDILFYNKQNSKIENNIRVIEEEENVAQQTIPNIHLDDVVLESTYL